MRILAALIFCYGLGAIAILYYDIDCFLYQWLDAWSSNFSWILRIAICLVGLALWVLAIHRSRMK